MPDSCGVCKWWNKREHKCKLDGKCQRAWSCCKAFEEKGK